MRTLVQMVDGALTQRRQTIARNGDMASESFACSDDEHEILRRVPESASERAFMDDGRRKLCGINIRPAPHCRPRE